MRNWLRLPPPLRLAIPALVLVFNLCFVTVTALTIIGRDRDREIARNSVQAAQQAERLARAAAEQLSDPEAKPQREFFRHELTFAGTEPDILFALLVTPDRQVLY